jgi:hypothetical protein
VVVVERNEKRVRVRVRVRVRGEVIIYELEEKNEVGIEREKSNSERMKREGEKGV